MSSPAAPAGPSAPAPPPHRSLEFFGSAVVAGLIALGGLILTIYTQKPGVVVPWALCVLGLSAFAPIIPQVPQLAQVYIVVVISVALISSSVVVFADPRLLTRTVQVVHGHGRPVPTFTTNIKLAPIAGPIPYCNNFLGSGVIPAGHELWIFDRDAEDPTAKYYLDSEAVAAGGTWVARNIEIGNGAGDTGNRTTIFAVLLPTPFMNWLVKTVNIAGGIPSPDLPAEAHIADEAVVTRNSDTKPCSF